MTLHSWHSWSSSCGLGFGLFVGLHHEGGMLVLGKDMSSTRTPRPPQLGGLQPPLLPLGVICK